jgi:hypothetical protein
MEDIVVIRLLFVAGVVGMAGLMALAAYAVERAGGWLAARNPAARGGTTATAIAARGTR